MGIAKRIEVGAAAAAVVAALLACKGGANQNQKGVGDQPGGVALGLGDIAVAPVGDYVLFKRGDELATGNLTTGAIDTLPVQKPSRLAFSKQRKPELEMTSIAHLLEEIVALVQRQFDARKVALLTAIDEDAPPIPLDASGIHQAVLNLLNNALDAVPDEKGVVTLSCEFDTQQQAVRIMVADNGEGIDPENRQRVFMPFYSTKGLRGTGLGLAVTKKIIDEHGGRISVETGEGQGTSFTIVLPLKREAARSGDTAGPGGDPSGESSVDMPFGESSSPLPAELENEEPDAGARP